MMGTAPLGVLIETLDVAGNSIRNPLSVQFDLCDVVEWCNHVQFVKNSQVAYGEQIRQIFKPSIKIQANLKEIVKALKEITNFESMRRTSRNCGATDYDVTYDLTTAILKPPKKITFTLYQSATAFSNPLLEYKTAPV